MLTNKRKRVSVQHETYFIYVNSTNRDSSTRMRRMENGFSVHSKMGGKKLSDRLVNFTMQLTTRIDSSQHGTFGG